MKIPNPSQALRIISLCFVWLQTSFLPAQQLESVADEIQWATETGDGLLVGLKLSPTAGVVERDEPLQFQFVIKNTTTERKALNCSAVSNLLLDLRADNVLQLRGYVRRGGSTKIEIEAGQVLEPEKFRMSVNTAQLLPGAYTIESFHAVWAATTDAGKEVSLGTLRKVGFEIVDHQSTVEPRTFPPEKSDLLYWGQPIMGLSLGAQLVNVDERGEVIAKSQRFHHNETLTLQLFLHNQRDHAVELELFPPRLGDPWELSVFTTDNTTNEKKRKLLRQMNRDVHNYRPNGLFTLQAGEQLTLTGVPIQTLTRRGTPELDSISTGTLQHAGFDIIAIGERRLQNPRPLLEADLGNYFVTATAQVLLRGTDISAAITSGMVPFRIVENPLRPESTQRD